MFAVTTSSNCNILKALPFCSSVFWVVVVVVTVSSFHSIKGAQKGRVTHLTASAQLSNLHKKYKIQNNKKRNSSQGKVAIVITINYSWVCSMFYTLTSLLLCMFFVLLFLCFLFVTCSVSCVETFRTCSASLSMWRKATVWCTRIT